MSPRTFSNFSPVSSNSALNILLLDRLNTFEVDQNFVRDQLLDYLKVTRPGDAVAIFGLSNELVMLQGFTSDPAILKAAVSGQIAHAANQLGSPAPELQTFLGASTLVQSSVRTQKTLDAMNQLAHYLATIPGRKNLIWFSDNFPIDVLADNGRPVKHLSDTEQEYRDTMNLLAGGEVAFYPVDARALTQMPTLSPMGSPGNPIPHPGSLLIDDNILDEITADRDKTMLRLAERTGGRALLRPESIGKAVEAAIDDGANYYALTYSPSEHPTDGLLQPIYITTDQKGVRLEYPRGYYADGPMTASPGPHSSDAKLISRTMAHGVPPSGDIVFKVRVLPAVIATDSSKRRYDIDFAVLAGDISFSKTPDGHRHFQMQFLSIAYSSDGSLVNRVMNQLSGSLTPEEFSKLQNTGFPYHQELVVPVKGDFSIRLGVHDLSTNHVGSTEMSVALVQNLPPDSVR